LASIAANIAVWCREANSLRQIRRGIGTATMTRVIDAAVLVFFDVNASGSGSMDGSF
jgi:hypothetical protein